MNANQLPLLGGLLAAILALVGISAAMLVREARQRDLEDRVVQTVWGDAGMAGANPRSKSLVQAIGERVRRGGWLYSQKDLEHLEAQILAAGYKPKKVLPMLLGAKLLLMILLPVVTSILAMALIGSLQIRLAVIGGSVVAGIMGPELLLGFLRRPYVAALERGTPDALDLLVVCSEAGLGLESALERVSNEIFSSNRPMAMALSSLLDDLRVLPSRREAFAKFGTRSGVEGLQRMATMLGQSLQYGTPLSHALRAVAGELRRQRMVKLEENAVKLPAKLIFPMVGFIMPSLYIVLLGPSFLRLYDALGNFTSHLPSH